MLNFHPAIIRDDVQVDLPRPVLVCRLHDSWDFLKLKVPLRDGDQLSGPSRDGVEITIEGQIGQHSGSLKLSEETMLEVVQTLRNALHVQRDEGYLLSLFRDDEQTRFCFFRNCLTSRLDIDFSNQRIFSYAISIHAADPVFYDGSF